MGKKDEKPSDFGGSPVFLTGGHIFRVSTRWKDQAAKKNHLSPQPLQLREPRPSMNVTFIVQDLGPGVFCSCAADQKPGKIQGKSIGFTMVLRGLSSSFIGYFCVFSV